MIFLQRSYGGKIFRPKPMVEFSPENGYLLICTPWGAPSGAHRVLTSVRDYFLSVRSDHESTSPFDRLSCLSSLANDLRISVKLANDIIYNEDNRTEYQAGFELFCLVTENGEAAWTHIGLPSVLLDRPNSSLIPLSNTSDLSTEFSPARQSLAPLPAKLLGVENSSDFETHSLRFQKGESLVLLSRSFLPGSLFALDYGSRSIEHISRVCSEDDPHLPFWTGVLNF